MYLNTVEKIGHTFIIIITSVINKIALHSKFSGHIVQSIYLKQLQQHTIYIARKKTAGKNSHLSPKGQI